MTDEVNHPEHYNEHTFECIDEMVVMFGAKAVYHFCICNAWKYRYRAPYKGDFEGDIKKADWYIEKAAELEGKFLPKAGRQCKLFNEVRGAECTS